MSKCLAGKDGGYRLVLEKLKGDEEESALKVAFTESVYNRCDYSSDFSRLGITPVNNGSANMVLKPQDIQNLITLGAFDFAVIGAHEIQDPRALVTLSKVGLPFELALAYKKDNEAEGTSLRIATPYPDYARRLFPDAEIIESYDTGAALSFSLADAALDLIDRLSGLKIEKAFTSPTLLVASRNGVKGKI